MRRLLVFAVLAALVLPAGALAAKHASGDGTLAVRNGDGSVRLTFRGAVLGKIGGGRLEVVDSDEECEDLRVWDADEVERKYDTRQKLLTCIFKGASIRFRLVGTQQDLRITARAINLSAVGRGKAHLKAASRSRPSGTYSVDGGRFVPLGPDGGWITVPGS